MTIDFEKTQLIVEKCWEISCKANLPVAGEMIQGIQSFNGVRMLVFQQLIGHLVPTRVEGNSTLSVDDKKEPWQE